MDPACVGPRFPKTFLVKKGVAEYTEVLHSSGTLGIGDKRKLADVDFVLNDGRVQPTCNIFSPFCNHFAAVVIFENTIEHKKKYVGKNKNGECEFGPYKKDITKCKGTYVIRSDEIFLKKKNYRKKEVDLPIIPKI